MPRAYSINDMFSILDIEQVPVIQIDPSFYDKKSMEKFVKKTRIWGNALGKYDSFKDKNEGFDLMLKEMAFVNIIQTDHPEEWIKYLRNRESK